jgi:hypothetical protein
MTTGFIGQFGSGSVAKSLRRRGLYGLLAFGKSDSSQRPGTGTIAGANTLSAEVERSILSHGLL